MNARRDEPAAEPGAELRERVLGALRELLATRTFASISVAEVIAAAGVSRASFYFYFRDKQAALAELVRRAVGAGHEAARPWIASAATDPAATDPAATDPVAMDPAAALRSGISDGAELWLANAGVLRAIVESWGADEQLRALWLAQMATFTAATVARIEADPAAMRRLAGTDVPALAASLTWLGERLYYLAASGVAPFDDREVLVDTLTRLWTKALS